MSLVELLTTVALLGVLASASWHHSRTPLAYQTLLAATRQLELGLEQARDHAMDQQAPCALALGELGWQQPEQGDLPGCRSAKGPLLAGDRGGGLQLKHNITALQFTANGLVLGGGTVRLAVDGLAQEHCLVISLPLGITRRGYWENSQCVPPASAET